MNKPLKKTNHLLLFVLLTMACSCNQTKENQHSFDNSDGKTLGKKLAEGFPKTDSTSQHSKDSIAKKQEDNGAIWLKSLFKCRNAKNYCFYLATEKEVCTDSFYQFMIDSEQIFGASNLYDHEYPTAVMKYKEKWAKIYPLRTETEPWLFSRGQDDMENISKVSISKTSTLNYLVFVDFGNDVKTESNVKLVENNKGFKINYCETTFLKP